MNWGMVAAREHAKRIKARSINCSALALITFFCS
jgi:hypothetical protein